MVKAGVDLVGLYGGPVRPPRQNITGEGREQVAQVLKELDVPRNGLT